MSAPSDSDPARPGTSAQPPAGSGAVIESAEPEAQPPFLVDEHLAALGGALVPFRREAARLARLGAELAWVLGQGGRLLAAGNGGSAAEAQHLVSELTGKLRDDRTPLSAIALCAESAGVTAISNDFGYEEVFARQVRAHGRPGDVLILLSTSGRSPNLLAAADAGHEAGLRVWGFTGPAPNPLAERCREVLAVPAEDPQVVQELHLVGVHLLCEYGELALRQLVETAASGDALAPANAPGSTNPLGPASRSGLGNRPGPAGAPGLVEVGSVP